MSVEMIQAFKRCGAKSTARLVAYMLADHHNKDTGRCDPSIETLMDETALTDRAISTAIHKLASDGHITIQTRKGCRNSYLLHPIQHATPERRSPPTRTSFAPEPPSPPNLLRPTPEPYSPPPPNMVPVTPEPYSPEPERTGIVTVKEPELHESEIFTLAPSYGLQKTQPGDAEVIYKAYPRKVGCPSAMKAIRAALKDEPIGNILSGLERWDHHWREDKTKERGMIPYPATFFNRHQWKDDPPPLFQKRYESPRDMRRRERADEEPNKEIKAI